MDKMKKIAGAALLLIGKALLLDLGIFALVSLSCLIGTRCTAIAWGERLFWVGLILLLIAGGAAIVVLGSVRRPNYRALGHGAAYEPFETDEEKAEYERRGRLAGYVGLMSLGIILISVLIDTLARR